MENLERTRPESPESDLLLFNGRALAGPILLSLATALALKALLCLERKKDPPRIHDLLKLFEQLEPDTQEMLEARMRKVSTFPISAAVPSMQKLNPHLQEMFGVRMGFATGNGEGSRPRIRPRIAFQNPGAQVVVAILRGHGPFATPGQWGMLIGYARVSPQETREESPETGRRTPLTTF